MERIQVLWGVLLLLSVDSIAQTNAEAVYRTRLRTRDGQHISGTLDEVTTTYLYIDSYPIALNNVRKIVLSRTDATRGTIAGAVVGAISTGYLTNRSLQNEQVSNRFLYGVSLVLGAAAGAAIGGVVGHSIGKLSQAGRVVFLPRTGDEAVQSLARQLRPFSRNYQEELQNRPPQPLN